METGISGGRPFRRSDYNPLQLAYLGDAYYELLARESLLGDGQCKLAQLNDAVRGLVTAEGQSSLLELLLPHLTEEETAIYRSGRNARSPHRTKSASAIDYRRATGLECLFGYLWLTGQQERARELFRLAAEGRNGKGKDES